MCYVCSCACNEVSLRKDDPITAFHHPIDKKAYFFDIRSHNNSAFGQSSGSLIDPLCLEFCRLTVKSQKYFSGYVPYILNKEITDCSEN